MTSLRHWCWQHRQILLLLFGVLLLFPLVAHAQTVGPGIGLSKRMYCYTYTLLASRLGLIIGLVLGIVGLFTIVQERVLPGVILIIIGALLPAIMSTLESFYEGLSSVLFTSGLSVSQFTSHASGFDSLGVGNDPSQCDSIYVAPLPNYDAVAGTSMGGSTVPATSADGTPLGNSTPTSSNVGSCDPGASCPRWQNDNNPGNLRAIPGVTYPGQTGVDNKGFATFDNMSDGLAQLNHQTDIYSSKYGVDTIASQISRYAPSSENNTPAYVADVVSQLRSQGYDVNANSSVSALKAANSNFGTAYSNTIAHHETGKWVSP